MKRLWPGPKDRHQINDNYLYDRARRGFACTVTKAIPEGIESEQIVFQASPVRRLYLVSLLLFRNMGSTVEIITLSSSRGNHVVDFSVSSLNGLCYYKKKPLLHKYKSRKS